MRPAPRWLAPRPEEPDATTGHAPTFALLWCPDSAVQLRLSPLLMLNGLLMIIVTTAEELQSWVNSKKPAILFAGPGPALVSAANRATLTCESVVPLVRLLHADDKEPATKAAIKLDASLSVAKVGAALADARALLDVVKADDEKRTRLRKWTKAGGSAATGPSRGILGVVDRRVMQQSMIEDARANAEPEMAQPPADAIHWDVATFTAAAKEQAYKESQQVPHSPETERSSPLTSPDNTSPLAKRIASRRPMSAHVAAPSPAALLPFDAAESTPALRPASAKPALAQTAPARYRPPPAPPTPHRPAPPQPSSPRGKRLAAGGMEWHTENRKFVVGEYIPPDGSGKGQYLEACHWLETDTWGRRSTGTVPQTRLLMRAADETVSMRHAGLSGGKAAEALGAWLAANDTCEQLDLTRNRLGADGVDSLAKALRVNSKCQDLNVSGNGASSEYGAPPSELCALLASYDNALLALDLSSNNLDDSGCAECVRALIKGYQLENGQRCPLAELNLGGNRAAKGTATALKELLEMDTCKLEALRLSWSMLGIYGEWILLALKDNKSLQLLDVSWCGIEEAGAIAIGTAMRTNETLTSLDVSHNRIGPWGAEALADGLAFNSHLKYIDLSANPLGKAGVDALVSRGAQIGRTLHLQKVGAGWLLESEDSRPRVDESQPGGHFKLNLDQPYDRFLLDRCVDQSRLPSDGSPRDHSRRTHNAVRRGPFHPLPTLTTFSPSL